MPDPQRKPNRTPHPFVGLGIFILGILPWFITNDVARLIARQKDVILGRYTLLWFNILCILTIILWLIAWSVAFPSRLPKRIENFRNLALTLAVTISVLSADLVWRLFRKSNYVEGETAQVDGEEAAPGLRLRQKNQETLVEWTDAPAIKHPYPNMAPGLGTVKVQFKTDSRGFRNATEMDHCDILAMGDSFTEGSRVSNNEAWPALLSEKTGQPVYNMGMSGTSPIYYLEVYKRFGADLSPKTVICSIYEGNDFRERAGRDSVQAASFFGEIEDYFSASPIRLAARQAMVDILGGMNTSSDLDGADVFSWMPLAVPTGQTKRHYAFTPQRVLDLSATKDAFVADPGWKVATKPLRELAALCKMKEIRLIFLYVPTAAHVVMPLATEAIPAGALRRFCAFEEDDLPPADKFKEDVFANIEAREEAFAEFCDEIDVELVRLTAPLRAAAAASIPVYYTYDQHWSVQGHIVASSAIAEVLSASPASLPASRP